jgi:coenzyme PQQ precursor peptide PqqA
MDGYRKSLGPNKGRRDARRTGRAQTRNRMEAGLAAGTVVRIDRCSMAGGRSTRRGLVMKWETPQASDHRFGFEITMYISTR